jgi:alpha-tubulin suppressor-like RCC1 family protein
LTASKPRADRAGIRPWVNAPQVPTAVNVEKGAAKQRLRVVSAAAGTWHSLVLAEDHAVYAFGRCQYGQLGIKCHTGSDKSSDQFHPAPVEILSEYKVVAVAAGAAHSLAVVVDNR